MNDEIIDVEEAAEYLHLNVQTVRAMARQGKLPCFKVGRSWRFRKHELFNLESQNKSAARKGGHSVLVIDDDKLVHYLIEASLKGLNLSVEKALNGKSGIEILRQKKIDFVFLDLSMPEMDGPQVLKVIRAERGNIPVVIVTSYPDSELMEKAMKFGPVILLAKPFSPQQVLDCLEGLTGTVPAY